MVCATGPLSCTWVVLTTRCPCALTLTCKRFSPTSTGITVGVRFPFYLFVLLSAVRLPPVYLSICLLSARFLFICPSICCPLTFLFICPSVCCPFAFLFICPSVCCPLCIFLCASVCCPLFLPSCPSVWCPLCLFICPSVCCLLFLPSCPSVVRSPSWSVSLCGWSVTLCVAGQ